MPPNSMPGPHLDAFVAQCFADVGGSDLWTSSYYQDNWWVGWHTGAPFHHWYLSEPHQWFLIGYEKWRTPLHGMPHMRKGYYAEPNPSTSVWGSDLTPVGHWQVAYNSNGHQTHRKWSSFPLTWDEEAFLAGRRQKGEWFPKGKGKGKKGKDMGKNGMDKGKGIVWAA